MKRGDYVLIYDGHEEAKIVGSGLILEDYDIPNTFGRRMYVISISGQQKSYDDAYYSFEILSSVDEELNK